MYVQYVSEYRLWPEESCQCLAGHTGEHLSAEPHLFNQVNRANECMYQLTKYSYVCMYVYLK